MDLEKLADTTLQDLSNLDHGLCGFDVSLIRLEKEIKEKEWVIDHLQESFDKVGILYPEFTEDEIKIKKQIFGRQISKHNNQLYQLKKELETKQRIKKEKLDNCGRAMMQLIRRKMPHLLQISSTSCICCAKEENKFFANKCGHVLCKECWNNTKKSSKPCPLCKQKVYYKTLREIKSSWYDLDLSQSVMLPVPSVDKTSIVTGPYRDHDDSDSEEVIRFNQVGRWVKR